MDVPFPLSVNNVEKVRPAEALMAFSLRACHDLRRVKVAIWWHGGRPHWVRARGSESESERRRGGVSVNVMIDTNNIGDVNQPAQQN